MVKAVKTPPVERTTAGKQKASELEHKFLRNWFHIPIACPQPIPEHPGIEGNRRYKFDFAFPFITGGGVVVEMEGITNFFQSKRRSRHLTVTGYTNDCIKYNLAGLQGWWVFRATQLMMRKDVDCQLFVQQIQSKLMQFPLALFDPRCYRLDTQTQNYEAWCALWEYPPPPPKPLPKPRKKKATTS